MNRRQFVAGSLVTARRSNSSVGALQGWLVIFAVRPLVHAIGFGGLLWLAAGGAAYTLGIIFFALDRIRYFHAAWHLCVLAGSVAHYFAVLFYIVPRA